MNDPRPNAPLGAAEVAGAREAARPDAAFDDALRRTYQQGLEQLSTRTQRQLHHRLHAAVTPSARPGAATPTPWRVAAACSLVLALAVGIHWRAPLPSGATRTAAVASGATTPGTAAAAGVPPATALASLDQPPDLYVWLASDDARAMIPE